MVFETGLIGALPAVHELAEQAGIDLPPDPGHYGFGIGQSGRALA